MYQEYRWNEWEMRKDALKMANAKKAKTTSVQTENAKRDYGEYISNLYSKLPVGIQVSAPMDRDIQTNKNDATTTTGDVKSFILGKNLFLKTNCTLFHQYSKPKVGKSFPLEILTFH